eukprot:5055315-Ditylum_brightwellii.AAC.1
MPLPQVLVEVACTRVPTTTFRLIVGPPWVAPRAQTQQATCWATLRMPFLTQSEYFPGQGCLVIRLIKISLFGDVEFTI